MTSQKSEECGVNLISKKASKHWYIPVGGLLACLGLCFIILVLSKSIISFSLKETARYHCVCNSGLWKQWKCALTNE